MVASLAGSLLVVLKGFRMVSKKLIDELVRLLLPRLMTELVKVLEELLKQDLDKDGKVGFGGQ